MSHIRCMRFSGRIKFPQNSEYAQYSDATKCDSNDRNAMHEHLCERRNVNRSYLCVCFAIMRLLLSV